MDNVNIIDDNLSNGSLTITPQISNFLKETAKWAKFLAIVGFIFAGITIIIGIGMSFFMGQLASSMPNGGEMDAMSGGFVGVFYILMSLLYILPCLYLLRFANKMKLAISNNDQAFLSNSFENLKSCYKFMGIMMAVIMGIYAIGIVIGLVSFLFMDAMAH